VAIVAGAWTAFGGALERPAIQHGRRRIIVPALHPAQQGAQVTHHIIENASDNPTLGLLVDGGPGREIRGQIAPLGTGPHDPPQRIEDLP